MYEETTSESLGVRWIMSSLLIIFLARRWKMLTLLISNTSSKTFLSPSLSVDNLLNTNSIASSFFWIFIKTPLGHLHTIAGKSTNIPLPSIRKRKASTQNNKKHWSEFFWQYKRNQKRGRSSRNMKRQTSYCFDAEDNSNVNIYIGSFLWFSNKFS